MFKLHTHFLFRLNGTRNEETGSYMCKIFHFNVACFLIQHNLLFMCWTHFVRKKCAFAPIINSKVHKKIFDDQKWTFKSNSRNGQTWILRSTENFLSETNLKVYENSFVDQKLTQKHQMRSILSCSMIFIFFESKYM